MDVNKVIPSIIARNTYNPIRKYQENRSKQYPNHEKSKVMFHIGDPTINEYFRPNPRALKYMADNTKIYGYFDQSNTSKKYIANKFSNNLWKLDEHDVILTTGASNGILISILTLCDEGDVLLGPSPGFPLAKTICDAFGIIYRPYELKMEDNWTIDLDKLDELKCEKTRAILVNNPSNPTGAVWSKDEVKKVVLKCEELQLPIISDDVYKGFVFSNTETADFFDYNTKVPVLSIGSASKMLFAPGWRIGWLICYATKEVKDSLIPYLNKLIHINSFADIITTQHLGDVMRIYEEDNYIQQKVDVCERNYLFLQNIFKDVNGFKLNKIGGGIFGTISVEIENFKQFEKVSDMTLKLEEEQNLYFMPGDLFNKNNFMRFTNIANEEEMVEMVKRLKEFSNKYYNKL